MKHPRVMELRDTKITIEIEARRIPDEVLESNLRQLEESGEEGVVFPYRMDTRLKIGDRQIGLVQGLLLMVQNGVVAPRMAIDLGGHPEMSQALKDSLDMTADQLKQFPFINWAIHGAGSPEHLVPSSGAAVCARSVEELLPPSSSRTSPARRIGTTASWTRPALAALPSADRLTSLRAFL